MTSVLTRGATADSRIMPQIRHARIRPFIIFGVATALGFFSVFPAYYFVATFTEKPAPFACCSCSTSATGIRGRRSRRPSLWLSRRFPFDKRRWHVSLPVAHRRRARRDVAPRRAGGGVADLADLTTGGRRRSPRARGGCEAQRDVLPELRLGDDDLLGHRRPQPRARATTARRRTRALSAAQLETRLVEAQLQALQRQLQPHFLFNTLNTISALMHRDVEAADAMIARLSDLLRMSLQTVGVQEVPLKEELDFLSKYLEIEQTRFRRPSDRACSTSQPDTLDALVPNLLLQPLVENAHQARHRSAGRAPGTIDRPARRVGSDARAGGAGQRRRAARRHGCTDFNAASGLSNTRSRLEHLYGSLAPVRVPAARRGRAAGAASPFRSADAGGRDGRSRTCRARGGGRMTKIRTLVVDDEPMARERIVGLLAQEKDIEVVGECCRRHAGRVGHPAASRPTWCSSTCRCRRATASA